MAFSSTTSLELTGTYCLHDFASGAFNITTNLQLGVESFFSSGGGLPKPITIYQYPGNTAVNGANTSLTEGYGILADHGTNGTDLIANITGLDGGAKLTKVNWNLAGVPSTYIGNLVGPYTFSYTTEGAKTPRFLLYRRSFNTWQGGSNLSYTPAPPYPQVVAAGDKVFNFTVYQKAVSVTRKTSASGPILNNGVSINGMDTLNNKVVVLNKASNRGDSVSSVWIIKKQDSNGVYQTATLTTDYSLGLGQTLSSDQITLTWEDSGNYRVINRSQGQIGGTIASNIDEDIVNFNVGASVTDTVVLPLLSAIVTPVTAFNNTVVSTSPLVGVTTFSFTVSHFLNTENASWTKTTDSDPPVELTLDEAAWEAELVSRCDIFCQVKLGTSIVESRVGLGPHTFSLPTGNYDVGYITTPKSGNTLIFQLAEINSDILNQIH